MFFDESLDKTDFSKDPFRKSILSTWKSLYDDSSFTKSDLIGEIMIA